MEEIDKETQKTMISMLLIEQAALRMWFLCKEKIPSLSKDTRIVFLCGGGNNGSDALAAARSASVEGYRNISCIVLPRGNEIHMMEQFFISNYPAHLVKPEDALPVIGEADVIFEGLCGTGLKSALTGTAKVLVEAANGNTHAYKIAIDMPAGMADDLPCSENAIFKSDLTVTMGLEKVVFTHPYLRSLCGEVEVVNPCFPLSRLEACESKFFLADLDEFHLKPLAPDAYKKVRGHLFVFGGSTEFSGAARLCVHAAFQSRVGLISLYVDDAYYPIAVTESPSVMVRKVSLGCDLDGADAILAGPGWGAGREELLKSLLVSEKPMVLDADGIKAFANLVKEGKVTHGPLVMTPHLGELSYLSKAVLGIDITHGSIREFLDGSMSIARKTDSILVIKSSMIHVVSADGVVIMEGCNPSLGVAGSGDVLSGIIAALFAGGLDGRESALCGSAIHQKAGRLARDENGYYDSETLVGFVGRVVRELEQ